MIPTLIILGCILAILIMAAPYIAFGRSNKSALVEVDDQLAEILRLKEELNKQTALVAGKQARIEELEKKAPAS